ncbi:MAG TPA: hypothetical protein IAB39_00110 [Candidatus Onthovicinus excrementipullorum]|nr:hypothetical protein [Candidatus Onthovicinus excrementipullorum]
MKKRMMTASAVIALLLLLLSGCDFKLLSPDQLMRPPRYFGESAGLQEAFAETAGANAVLKAPYEGEYHSAFILEDLDGDGLEEALAFYVNSLDKNICQMMLFKSDGWNWSLCANIRGEGSEVVSVSLEDMDSDGVREIVVGWGISGSQDRMLSVYMYYPDSGYLRSLSSEPYRMMSCMDLDGDYDRELLLVTTAASVSSTQQDTAVPARLQAKLLKIQDTVQPNGTMAASVTAISEVTLSSAAVNCTQMAVQPATGDSDPATVFLDCTTKEEGMFTDILQWTDGRLVRIQPSDPGGSLVRDTYRTANITCRDINSDGYIEVPSQLVLAGSSNPSAVNASSSTAGDAAEAATDERVSLTVWCNFSGDKLVPIENSVINFSDSYMFLFKDDWVSGNFPNLTNNVTVVADITNRTWSFYDYDYATQVRGSLIFAIIAHPAGAQITAADEVLIVEDDTLTYTLRMGPAAASRKVTQDDVVNGFILLSNS